MQLQVYQSTGENEFCVFYSWTNANNHKYTHIYDNQVKIIKKRLKKLLGPQKLIVDPKNDLEKIYLGLHP